MSQDIEQYRPGFEAWARKEWPDWSLSGSSIAGQGWYYHDDVENDFWLCWIAAKREASTEPESVPIPTTVNMARMMLALGARYLQENAPEHLVCGGQKDEAKESAPGDALDARFHFDHGVWHDRVTGQHMWTQDQYDEAVRDARNGGPLPKVATSAESLVNVWNDALEEAAKICDQTYVSPGDLQVENCHEAAAKIREMKSCQAIATSTSKGEGE